MESLEVPGGVCSKRWTDIMCKVSDYPPVLSVYMENQNLTFESHSKCVKVVP